jgi:hypothetical protein
VIRDHFDAKPVIAMVHGMVAGAEFGFVLASDLVVSEKNTKFMSAFSKIGLVSDCATAFHLVKLPGKQRAKEIRNAFGADESGGPVPDGPDQPSGRRRRTGARNVQNRKAIDRHAALGPAFDERIREQLR